MRAVTSFIRLISISRLAILGASMVTATFISELMLMFIDATQGGANPYIGIVSYMVLPGFFVTGLLLIPVGILLRLRHLRRRLNLRTLQRLVRFGVLQHPGSAVKTIAILTLINVITFALLGYRGYHYMDSTTFCGKTCHSVMYPEYVAYQRSPHSQVECVQCHIGPGAKWFVKSKISGAWQVISVNLKLYDRPIPNPIDNLRPATDVCESCHRPELFKGNLIRVIQHYQTDQENTPLYTILNMRVGGGGDALHEASGIHWHVAHNHKLRYYATDHKREHIEWIEDVQADGTKRVWTRPGSKITEADIDPAKTRTMDCVDCHNRPTHVFDPPVKAIEQAMSADLLDPTLPWIRKVGEQVITEHYDTTEAAMAGIAAQTRKIYQEQYPAVWKAEEARIDKAIAELQAIYSGNVFPSMKITWNTYPSQIGHTTPTNARCFRCHDGLFREEGGQGQPIPLDCNTCHYVLASGTKDPSGIWLLQRDPRFYGKQPTQAPPMPDHGAK